MGCLKACPNRGNRVARPEGREHETLLKTVFGAIQGQREFLQHRPVDEWSRENLDRPVVLEERHEITVIVVDVAQEDEGNLIARDPARAQVRIQIRNRIHQHVIAVVTEREPRRSLGRAESGRSSQDLHAHLHKCGRGEIRRDRIGRRLFVWWRQIDRLRFAVDAEFEDNSLLSHNSDPPQIDRFPVEVLGSNHCFHGPCLALLVFQLEPARFPGQSQCHCLIHAPFLHLVGRRAKQVQFEQFSGSCHPATVAN